MKFRSHPPFERCGLRICLVIAMLWCASIYVSASRGGTTAIIPNFETVILEIHQSLGLPVPKKKTELMRLERSLEAHDAVIGTVIDEIFTALGLVAPYLESARATIAGWARFNNVLERSTWTFDADQRQVIWHLAGYWYAADAGRRLATWVRAHGLDAGMPGGRFWFLPDVQEKRGVKTLFLPVPQVLDWWLDLLGQSIDEIAPLLGGGADSEGKSKLAKVEVDSIKRALAGWRTGTLPRSENIERYFAGGTELIYKGALTFKPEDPLETRFQVALTFVKERGLTPDMLRQEIPIILEGALESILAGSINPDIKELFCKLLAKRYAPPTMRLIRQRLLIARAMQDGYFRLGELLQGKSFDETSIDASKNKILQLLGIFKNIYNMKINAEENSKSLPQADTKFEANFPLLYREGLFLSVMPSRSKTTPSELAELLTRRFERLTVNDDLEDHVGDGDAAERSIVARNADRFFLRANDAKTEIEVLEQLKSPLPWRTLEGVTSYWVVSQIAQYPELSLKIRNLTASRLLQLANTPQETVGALCIQLSILLNGDDRNQRPENSRLKVAALISEARTSIAFRVWSAPILQYEAKHHLAMNEFVPALKLFNESLDACKERSFGIIRSEIARDALALVIAIKPNGFNLGANERYYRNMLAYGSFSGPFPGIAPTFNQTAAEMETYFWETLYRPYSGERYLGPNAAPRKQ